MCCMLKLKNYIPSMFKNIIQSVRKNNSFNYSKRRRMELYCSKKLSALLRGLSSKHDGDFYCLNCPLSFRTKKQT